MTFAEYRKLDAGQQREQLAQLMAEWIDYGFKGPTFVDSFRARARLTARITGMTEAEVTNAAVEDANLLLEIG